MEIFGTKMPRPSIDWVTADSHINHHRLQQILDWPTNWVDIWIKNWKYYVAPQDFVYHLGDVIFYDYPSLGSIIRQLPGTKILLMGNHDRKSRKWYIKQGFAYVADMIVLDDIVLSHKPLMIFPDGVKYNIHGHSHTNIPTESWWSPKTHFLYSPEKQKWNFVKLDVIKSRLKGKK